jgi:succinate dehydrogenase / fumarate reductase flavoprotein subunit
LLVFGKRAGEHAAKYAQANAAVAPDAGEVNDATREALAPFDRAGGENPYAVQHELQELMQNLVGIVRREDEMQHAKAELAKLEARAAKVAVSGNREYNPGWHTALDLKHLLTVSEAIVTSALARKESRGGHFRDDYPGKAAEYGAANFVLQRDARGAMQISRAPIPPLPPELKQVVEENT